MEERIRRVFYRIIAYGVMGIGYNMIVSYDYPISVYGGAVMFAGMVVAMILVFV